MTSIGIVGAGLAGLHLGLHLLDHGVGATIYTDRTPDEMRAGRLMNTIVLHGACRARDRALRVNHWDSPEFNVFCAYMRIAGDPPIAFRGDLARPALFIDMRMYLPRLLEDFAERGGQVVRAAPGPEGLSALAAAHDLFVVATGRSGLASLFPRLPDRSPYDAPQRRLVAGLFHGIRFPDPLGLGFNVIPGEGEVFENQFLTAAGPVSGLLIEAMLGGPLEPVTRMSYKDDPRAFHEAVLEILRACAPATYARVDPEGFALTGPLDLVQGAVTPIVRRGHITLDGGRPALSVGDAHITYDPITGQGGNAGARAAWLLGEAIVARARAGLAFDEAFCAETSEGLFEDARPVSEWTNAFLKPPAPHVAYLLASAARNKALADAFVSNFDDPTRQWAVLSDPRATAAFVERHGAVAAA